MLALFTAAACSTKLQIGSVEDDCLAVKMLSCKQFCADYYREAQRNIA